MSALLLLLAALAAEPAPHTDWPALVQKPYADLTVPDPGLRPLLVTADGKPVTTPEGWNKVRHALREAWMKNLGQLPDKPAQLDVRAERTEHQDGYTRKLVSFLSEGDDHIPAYLLVGDAGSYGG